MSKLTLEFMDTQQYIVGGEHDDEETMALFCAAHESLGDEDKALDHLITLCHIKDSTTPDKTYKIMLVVGFDPQGVDNETLVQFKSLMNDNDFMKANIDEIFELIQNSDDEVMVERSVLVDNGQLKVTDYKIANQTIH